MNLPVGKTIESGVGLKEFNLPRNLGLLADKLFSGYVALMIEGFSGLEEGVLLYKKGLLTASGYEYCKYGITVYGNSALQQTLNAGAAEHGVVDVVALSVQQSDLVTAFNDKLKLGRELTKKEAVKLSPKQYTTKYAEQVLSTVLMKEETKHTLLKRLGLGGVEKK